MDIAFVTKRYDTMGGTERDLYELTRRLALRGHVPHVYCLESRRPAADGVKVHTLGRGVGLRTARAWRLARRGPAAAYVGGHDLVVSYAKVLSQDIIRCGGGVHRVFLDRMAAGGGLPAIVRRAMPYHATMCAIEQIQFETGSYRRVQAISKVVKQEIMDALAVPGDVIDIVYDGVDTERFHPTRGREDGVRIRQRHGLTPDVPVVLFVGNAFGRKGLDTLLRAMVRLREPDARCLVVGHDPRSKRYREFAREVGIAERTVFAGAREDVAAYYAAADALVLPSRHEAFGNTVLEAMACGLPVVVSRQAGAAEVLEGALAAGVVERADDDEELARRIGWALDARGHTALGAAARKTAERFSLDAHVRNVEEQYLRVMDEMRSR